MKKFEAGFGKWVVRYRWAIIIATIIIVAGLSSGVRFLAFNNDGRVFFSKENPQLQALEKLENVFTKNDNILFVIAPKDGNVFTRKTLAVIEELTDASWKIPFSSRVDSITNFQHTRAVEDDLIVENLVENAASLSDADLEYKKEVALKEPILVNSLISPSAHVTGVNVTALMPGEAMNETKEVADYAKKMIADFRAKYPQINFYLTGGIMQDNGFGEASEDDMKTLVPAMFLTLLLILGVTLRSFAGVAVTLIIIMISMLTGLGVAGWLGMLLNPASSNAPIIILTLAVADSVHILVTIFHQIRLGKSKHEAIEESIRVNLQPVFLTSLTTVIGFLTMNFSDAPPFRDLGNIVAIGITAAFFYSVFFLPALVAVAPLWIKPRADEAEHTNLNWLAELVINRRKLVFWGMLALIVALTSGITRIDLNDNFVHYFDDRYDFRRATDFTEDNLTGFDIIEYALESGEPGGINKPEYLATVERFANWYRKQAKVSHVNSITDVYKRLNRDMHGGDESFYKIPDKRDLAAQYLLLYQMSLPFGLDLNNQINVDKSSTRMIVTLKKTTTRELREAEKQGREWLRANAPKSMFTYGSGLSIVWANISERNINSMLGASFWALVLISGILTFALRSLKLGAVSLVPNLAPAFMSFGIWGMIVGQVGIAVSVLVALTLGIVVDDTIHFMSKYLRARREYGMNPPDAVRYSFNTVGTALWITSAALVAGFIVLSFSGFKVNSDMGMMTAITISMALILDFLFLPTLLMKVEGGK
ncbi:MAG TPA: RND family transporter [Nitrospirae bacterium]|nr:RND family transporter [Nitrospirota bacterium]